MAHKRLQGHEDSFVSNDPTKNNESVSPKEDKGKRLWKKVRYQLVEYRYLPGYLKDNEYILGHYRSEWPLKQVVLSMFTIHNETLNVWTHLIGFFLFLCLTICTATEVPSVMDLHSFQHIPDVLVEADMHRLGEELRTSLPSIDILPSLSGSHVKEPLYNCLPDSSGNHTDACVVQTYKDDFSNIIAPLMVRPITRWPFFAFLGGAMFCMLASSTCHLLSCHSERMSYIMLRLDYIGISALISTSFYPPVYYSFMCYPLFCNLYMGFITLLGIGTILGSLLPVFQTPQFRTIRASLFLAMGLSGVVPILHKLYIFCGKPEVLHTTGCEILMGILYGLGALLYATRVPERWMPGRFDIAGHSHQLFHVFVVAGAFTHYQAGLVYLRWRDRQGC